MDRRCVVWQKDLLTVSVRKVHIKEAFKVTEFEAFDALVFALGDTLLLAKTCFGKGIHRFH